MSTINVNFREPKVLNKRVVDGKLELFLNWGKFGNSLSLISKTTKGFSYEDVGFMKRNFKNIDSMIFEFELPRVLKNDIEKLSII